MPTSSIKSLKRSNPILLKEYASGGGGGGGEGLATSYSNEPLLSPTEHMDSYVDEDAHPLMSEGSFNPPSYPSNHWRKKSRCKCWIIALIGFITLIAGSLVLSKSQKVRQSLVSFRQNFQYEQEPLGLITNANSFPERLMKSETICNYCDCKANRTSPPLLLDSSSEVPPGTRASMLAHVWNSIRDIYCQHAWLGEGTALDLLLQTRLSNDIQSIIQWRLDALEPGLPTAYLFTKTSWAGKTKHLRYAFFKRHILTIRTHIDIMRREKWPEGEGHPDWGQKRQLIWIIVEDGEKLGNDVAQEMIDTDLPYIYFTYGPTHHFGNAQLNAAYALIHRLSDPALGGIFGHGPVMSIDDDSNFLPELLVMIWDVNRIGAWPMGNLGPDGWEGPVYDPHNHTLLKWELWPTDDRKFPLDNGAFAFSSHLLGTTIKGPRYWPTDISGGENEFISLIVDKKEDLEPLCYNCHVAWHNEPLPPACSDLQICP